MPVLTVGEQIAARLLASPAVVALVGTRLYPDVIAQEDLYPAICWSVIRQSDINSLSGFTSNALTATAQVDVYARSRSQAQLAAAAIEAALGGVVEVAFTSSQSQRRDSYEDDVQLYRASIDFQIWSAKV